MSDAAVPAGNGSAASQRYQAGELRVVIAGGGTGGHLFPAVALAKALTTNPDQPASVLMVGSRNGPERQTAVAEGLTFAGIDVVGFKRSLSPRNLMAAALGGAATVRAVGIIRRARAQVVVGTGAYVSVPVAAAAALLRIPLVLHEQNAVPGVANRLAGRWAAAVAVSFPDAQCWFRAPATVTGNPVRPQLAHLDRAALRPAAWEHFSLEPGRRTLLVFGGSQGARSINEAVFGAYDSWREDGRLQILHLVGPKELAAAQARLASEQRPDDRVVWRPVGFTDRMELAYAAADLALCRSGAATVFELAAAALPAIVVPYPHATADHQRANAQPLVEIHAVKLILNSDCTPAAVSNAVDELLFDEERLGGMGRAIASFARPDAAQALASLVREVGRRR